MSIPNAQCRDGRWFFRRRVPDDLQCHFINPKSGKPQKILLKSLDTSDFETAKERAAKMTVQSDRDFAALRGVKPDAWEPPATLVAALAHAEAEALAHRDDQQREYRADRDYHKAVTAGLRQAEERATQILKSAGLPDLDTIQTAVLTHAAKAETEARDGSPKPAQLSTSPTPIDGAITLRSVVPAWVARNGPGDNSQRMTLRAIKLFEEACGKIPLKDITKAHGAKFVAFLLDAEKRGFGRKTAGNNAACITTLMNIAGKEDLIERNPMDLSFDKNKDSASRKPWTDAELCTLFDSPLFSADMESLKHWENVTPTDGRALLLMLMHSGARIGEIAQLRRKDFQTHGGIVVYHVTPEAGTLKTKDSDRLIPIASHLLADPWFAQWLAEVMNGKRPDAPAMPSMAGRTRGPADTAGQWFRELRKALGLPAGALNGAHKFRHWIRTALAAKGVVESTADSITGHAAQGSAGRKVYTADASIPVMLEALDRVQYPKLLAVSGQAAAEC